MADESSDLMAMVWRLSEMPASDRSFVLTSLDKLETRDLERLLKQINVRAMSQSLQSLVSDCADGMRGIGITDRAARAIDKAATSQLAVPPIERTAVMPISPWARFVARVMGR